MAIQELGHMVPLEKDITYQDALLDGVCSLIQEKVKSRGVATIGVEGPPIYVSPHPDRRSQQWDSDAFRNGWQITDSLFSKLIPLTGNLQHWMLVDDYNRADEPFNGRHMKTLAPTVRSIREQLGNLSVLTSPTLNRRQIYLESGFVDPNRRSNQCSDLDSDFQLRKLLFSAKMEPHLSSLQLVVHPDDFKQQQCLTLANLLGQMKRNPPFSNLSKEERRKFIEQTYIHLWVTTEGKLEGATQPYWDGQKFVFKKLGQI